MIFYHGTNSGSWKKIQDEGVLWGGYVFHDSGGKDGYRYTYLTPEIPLAVSMAAGAGDILLEVEYEPHGVGVKDYHGGPFDNYGFNPPPGQTCWQFSVFKPISIRDVKKIEIPEELWLARKKHNKSRKEGKDV